VPSSRASSRSGSLFEVDRKEVRIREIEARMSAADFWGNPEAAQGVVTELKSVKGVVESYRTLHSELQDEIGLLEMCDDARDQAHVEEVRGKVRGYERRVEAVEVQALFTGRNDSRNVFISIHAGAGGVDAMDWTQMLERMYLRWLQQNGYEAEVLDEQEGEEAGLKSALIEVKGRYAFGYLKSEIGVHRLVRLSPFDANHRRQTSFAAVDIIPIHDDIDIEIKESDLKIDTYSAGGPGGQHVNKTQSAVRITHVPTGIVVQCQNQRSQILNRKYAMRNLASKLYELEERKRGDELSKLYGEKGEISFANQIRNYVMQPYTLVKDTRTDQETGNIQAVLDGALDPFIEAFLRWKGRKY
jgi:peptide chain release factor 2